MFNIPLHRFPLHLSALALVFAIALSLGATASLIVANAGTIDARTVSHESMITERGVVTNRAQKEGRQELRRTVRPYEARCVSQDTVSTCTGWPVVTLEATRKL